METINIVDIDGTIARHPQRGHHHYHLVGTDEPVDKIINLINTLDLDVDHTFFVSGRPETCRADTTVWLLRHVTAYNPARGTELLMRKEGDFRADDIVKREIYEEHIKDKYEVDFVIDDRNRVVKMWREQGLTVLQVADGDF